MDVELFQNTPSGELVPISGTTAGQEWRHWAFLPHPLGEDGPDLDGFAYRRVADARAALAALSATAARLPNPALFRHSALRLEAQSTAALEGTYEPLDKVLTAQPGDLGRMSDPSMREVLNYLDVAETAFAWQAEGRPWSVSTLSQLQAELLRGATSERRHQGVRDIQVVIGRRDSAALGEIPVRAARFVPPPPGADLESRLTDLLAWMGRDRPADIDPVVCAGMAHYTFESLHPFHDGNGRIGRLLIVLNLQRWGVLAEPTLTVSPWFEARRQRYYDALLGVSTRGDWSTWIAFFAEGLANSATATQQRMLALADVRASLKETISASSIRTANAHSLVDLAITAPAFSVKDAAAHLDMGHPGAKKLIDSLVALGVLAPVDDRTYGRRFHAPAVMRVLLG